MRLSLVLLFSLLIGNKCKCQELLQKDESYIRKCMIGEKGKLVLNRHTHDAITNSDGIILAYLFKPDKLKNGGLFMKIFMFSSEGKCARYLHRYHGYESLRPIFDKFENPGSGFSRKEGKTTWVSKNNDRISITIVKDVAFTPGPNFEINYIETPVGYVPGKTKLEENAEDLLRKLKGQER